jgi:hypothetical protein
VLIAVEICTPACSDADELAVACSEDVIFESSAMLVLELKLLETGTTPVRLPSTLDCVKGIAWSSPLTLAVAANAELLVAAV